MITELQVKEIIEANFGKEPYLDKLSEISKNDSKKDKIESLITELDDHRFYNYDTIKKKIYKGTAPKSPDMILFKGDEIVFIEFKCGRIEGKEKKCINRNEGEECLYSLWDIRLKAVEGGCIVLHDIIEKAGENVGFSDIVGLNKRYILVYKNEYANDKDYIHNSLYSYEIKFGLQIYIKKFFRDVHTVPKYAFIKWLKHNHFIDEIPK
ncbi:MAG TPA: hypothetical protein VK186_09950 [Candidatus Deferrimicrobium sp.]|nr:hypothetical protein [Candidatus Deferrimicrobium sp.]